MPAVVPAVVPAAVVPAGVEEAVQRCTAGGRARAARRAWVGGGLAGGRAGKQAGWRAHAASSSARRAAARGEQQQQQQREQQQQQQLGNFGGRARAARRARARALIYEKNQSILFKVDCNSSNLLHLPQNFIQQVVAPLCAVILRGRWPQAGKYWTPGACLVRMTNRHIAWRWYLISGYLST